MPVKWEGKVEQCVGRLHRDYKNKKDVIIYDHVDMHIPMFERMYQARFKTYRKIGYELFNNNISNKEINNAFFDVSNYLQAFNQDVLSSKKVVIISSTTLSINNVLAFISLIKDKQYEGIKFKIITRSLNKYDEPYKTVIAKSISELEMNGIEVIQIDDIYKRFAIIDESIVYYGTINLLGKTKEDESLIRVVDKELVGELLISQ